MDELINNGYGELLGEIKGRIRTAQYDALRAVNKELISLYWNIGELIVQRQQGETWGIRSSRNWRQMFAVSFQGCKASPPRIYGG